MILLSRVSTNQLELFNDNRQYKHFVKKIHHHHHQEPVERMLPCTPPIASALPRLDLSPWLKYVCSRLNCNFTNNNKKIRLTIRHHSNYHWELPIILTTTTLMTIIIVTFSTSCLAMVGSPSALFTSSLSWPHSVWHLHNQENNISI